MTSRPQSRNPAGRHLEILPNGLTILFQEIHQYPVVLFDMWVRAGSRDEREDEWGLSHFLEHMMFGGNGRYSREEFNRALFEIGGRDNAGTWNDVTDYHILVPSEHFERGLELHTALLTSPLLPESEFQRERDVVLEEIRLIEDDPDETLKESSENLLLAHLGYNHPILGTEQILNRMTVETMRSYYERHYVPAKMLLVIVGDFEVDKILPAVREAYSGFDRKAATGLPESTEPAQTGPRIYKLSGDIEATYLTILFESPPLKNVETYALDVLMEALGGCRSARLNARLSEELNLVTDIEAFNQSYMHAGKLEIEADLLDSSNLQPAVDEILEILMEVIREGLSEDEIERAKTRLLADRAFRNQRVTGVGDFYGQHLSLGSLELADKYMDRTLSVTLDQVTDVARKYLRPEKMLLGYNHPEKDGEVEVSVAGFDPGEPERQVLEAAHGEITRSIGISERASGSLEPVIREELPNGVLWLYQHNPATPSVAMHIYVRGGLAFETWETNGVAEVMHSAQRKGTRSMSAAELNLAIDSLGAQIETDSDDDFLSIEARFLARDLKKGFRLVSEMALEPSFDETEIEKVKEEVMGIILQTQDDTVEVAFQNLRFEIFGKDHPYGRPSHGTLESVPTISAGNVREFHEKTYVPGNIVVSIVGDVPESDVRTLVEETFGSLEPSIAQLPDFPSAQDPVGERIVTIQRDKSQVRIAMGKPGPSIFDRDYPAAKVMSAILGATAYSRLFAALRDSEGLAYDVYSQVERGKMPALFLSYMGTAPENYRAALDGLKREYKRLREEGPSSEELRSAISWLRGSTLTEHQGNNTIAESLGANEVIGLPYDFDFRVLEEYRNVTEADVLRVAERFCDPENIVISVCGPV